MKTYQIQFIWANPDDREMAPTPDDISKLEHDTGWKLTPEDAAMGIYLADMPDDDLFAARLERDGMAETRLGSWVIGAEMP